jgi:hypothetical protein
MSEQQHWHVRMERWLTDKVTPEIKIKSSFNYRLPDDYADLLNGIEQIDEAYRDSVFASINQHLDKKFGSDNFFPQELLYA